MKFTRTWAAVALSFGFLAHAAPIPATSTSSLLGLDRGLYFSEHGFSIESGGTSWVQSRGPKDIPALATVYLNPENKKGIQASLSVRVDRLIEEMSVRQYVKHWIRDFPRLGLEVLASKPVKVNGQNAFLVDVLQRDTARQIREVMFVKNRTAVVLVCRDGRESFEINVKACTDIIRTFRWRR